VARRRQCERRRRNRLALVLEQSCAVAENLPDVADVHARCLGDLGNGCNEGRQPDTYGRHHRESPAMRLVYFFTITSLSLSLAACGGDDTGETPDAGVDIGFNPPTVTLKANEEVAEDQWMEVGDADLTCLNTASADQPTEVVVTLTTKVSDFQSGNAVPGAMVEIFKGQNYMTVEDTATADTDAMVTLELPEGVTRFGYRMTSDTSMTTFLLNQTLPSSTEAMQTVGDIQSVSKATAATLPALIGQTRTEGTGVVAGALRDCQGREISGFIATMSSTPAEAHTITGADTYYFDSAV